MLERIIGWLGAGSACVVAGVEGAARNGAAAGARLIEAVDAGSKLVRLLNGFWKGFVVEAGCIGGAGRDKACYHYRCQQPGLHPFELDCHHYAYPRETLKGDRC